jgi:hypothetical protein
VTAGTLAVMALASAGLDSTGPRAVQRQEILQAMRESQGYDLTATTNGARSSPRYCGERVLSYRLLDFGDMTVFDDIRGLRGRPTSGILGLLFQLIGEGHVMENRMAISGDGLQVSRARARKAFFEVVSTVTVYPDGRTEKDVPPGRPDLAALEARLKQPLKLSHPPLECGGTP